MNRGVIVSAAFVMLVGRAMAQDRCQEPLAPMVPDGKTAAVAQLSAAAVEVKKYIKDSDDYQNCLLTDLSQRQDQAKKDKKDLDPAIKTSIEAKGEANQKEKERVGTEFNAAVVAYKAEHPK